MVEKLLDLVVGNVLTDYQEDYDQLKLFFDGGIVIIVKINKNLELEYEYDEFIVPEDD